MPPTVTKDLLASIVVFLVALPLCMGIAIASGVPPALGLITGVVGGLVVGALAGSPLQQTLEHIKPGCTSPKSRNRKK
ncbi:MAG TPA: SulP family inorganic anion transporter [Bryobacteraceae bacterium]|nr:SulP family inorganic anion transporter [Bryobacteraceae bacterium]